MTTEPDALSLTAVQDQLLEVFLRYYDTAYGLRDDGIVTERRALLRGDTTLLQQPYVELLPDWAPADADVPSSCRSAGAPSWLACSLPGS